MLDSWVFGPPADRSLELDLSFARINDLPPNDDNVENEAILMAINSHGLQNVPIVEGIPVIAPSEQLPRTVASEIPICEDSDSSDCSGDYKFKRNSRSAWSLDELDTQNVYENRQSDEEADNVGHSWRQVHDDRNLPGLHQFCYHDKTLEELEQDFMESAVFEAIRSRGLMAAGRDFG